MNSSTHIRIGLIAFFVISSMVVKAQEEKPNVLFVLCDQWRKQSLGFLGEDPVITPNIDAFAKEAVFFSNAVCTRPICAPNRASLFSGQYPINTGVYGNKVQLAKETITLGDVAKKSGYKTGYIGKWHLDGDGEGFVPAERRHGFDYWIMSQAHSPFNQRYYIQNSTQPTVINYAWEPDWITDRAIDYLKSVEKDPFVLVVSYGPPHTGGGPGFEDRWQPGKRTNGKIKYGYGYAAPDKYEALYPNPEHIDLRPNVEPVGRYEDPSWETIPGYFGAITSIDENFGRLIEVLKDEGIFENTIVVFTSDHGEMLGSHGKMTKGIWYEESIAVPFLIAYPKKLKSSVVNEVFNSIDVMPTILGLVGVDIPNGVDGTDFSERISSGSQKNLPEAAFLSFDQGLASEPDRAWRAVRTDRYLFCLAKTQKYKEADSVKDGIVLYDLKDDPYQMNPIYRGMGYDSQIDHLFIVLKDHLEETKDPFLTLQWKTDLSSRYKWKYASERTIPTKPNKP